MENELNMVKYDVEKSTDGIVFARVNTMKVTGVNNPFNNYSWLDINAMPGNNFYRIKCYDLGGEIKYSSIVKVAIEKGPAGFSIFPNPVTGNTINLVMTNKPAGMYHLTLTNATGQVIFVKTVQGNGGNSSHLLKTATKLTPGIYELEIKGEGNNYNTQKVIAE